MRDINDFISELQEMRDNLDYMEGVYRYQDSEITDSEWKGLDCITEAVRQLDKALELFQKTADTLKQEEQD